MKASVRSLLEAMPLLGLAVEIRGVSVRRSALLTFKVGDGEHDLDDAEHVLEGRLPLRGPVESFGRISETWIIGPGGEAHRRARALRSALGGRLRQDTIRPAGFSVGEPAKLSLLYLLPVGIELPSFKPDTISRNSRLPRAEQQDMGISWVAA